MKTSHRFRAVAHRIGIFVVLALIGAAVFALLGETNATSAQDANRDNPSKVSIPLAKCVGFLACQGINPSLVADGSCNGDFACYGADGPIGAGSCNNNAACGTTFGAIGAGSCNGNSACANAPGAIGNNSCNTTGTTCKGSFVGGTGTFPVGDCQRNDVTPAACLLPPQPTTLPPQPLPPPEQPQALELSVVAFAPVVTVVPTGAATRDTKTYDVVFTIQNVSRIAAPAVLAHLTIPQELKVTSVAWEKEGQFYIDGDLPRKCSFDGLSAYCGIGQLWSGMKASVKLRVTADAGTYTLAIAAQDLSSISEVSNNNQSKSLKLILP